VRPLLLAALLLAAPAVRAEEAKPEPAAASATPAAASATAAAAPAAPAPAPAEPKPASKAKGAPRHFWELDPFAGYGQIGYPAVDTSSTTWWNGGPGFALSVAYRGPHFTHPFLDIAYVPIISSGRHAYDPRTGGTLYASNSSSAIGLIIGPGFDISWFRIRAGLGLYSVSVRTTVDGVENKASQTSLGFLVSAAGMVWRPDPFALGVEARLAMLQSPTAGIYQLSWVAGLTGRWDFARH
jgi:hypothetical protein